MGCNRPNKLHRLSTEGAHSLHPHMPCAGTSYFFRYVESLRARRSNVASARSVSRSQSLSLEWPDTDEGPCLRCPPWSIAHVADVDGIASLSACRFLKAICVEMAVISVSTGVDNGGRLLLHKCVIGCLRSLGFPDAANQSHASTYAANRPACLAGRTRPPLIHLQPPLNRNGRSVFHNSSAQLPSVLPKRRQRDLHIGSGGPGKPHVPELVTHRRAMPQPTNYLPHIHNVSSH